MIEFALLDKIGDRLAVESHPEFVDFELRDSRERTNDARLGIATDNIIAPIALVIADMTALDAYPTIATTLATLEERHPHRDDGLRPLALLLEWVRRWPLARIIVSGAEALREGPALIEAATVPRYSSRGWTVDPMRAQPISDLERMESVTKIDIGASSYVLDDSNQDISWEAALQREVRVKPKGGSKSKGKSKKDGGPPTAKELNAATDRSLQDDGMGHSTEVVAVRVAPETKHSLDKQGRHAKRRVLEAVAAAFDAGMTEDALLNHIRSCA